MEMFLRYTKGRLSCKTVEIIKLIKIKYVRLEVSTGSPVPECSRPIRFRAGGTF